MLRRLTFTFLFLLLALVCAGFVRLNGAATVVELYVAAVPATVGQALTAAFLAGWALGVGGALVWVARLARERRALARALKLAEGEVRTLRAVAPAHAR
jgi:ABC-type thiamin/hydroxymethylpyrimidine transport system permease subunit